MGKKDKPVHIVITAGSTSERIDSVRKITNSSTGKLGFTIAERISARYPNAYVTIIANKEAFRNNRTILRGRELSGLYEFITVESTDDLYRETKMLLTKTKPDIFIHSMAVADYAVDKVFSGKHFARLIKNGSDIDKAASACRIDTDCKIDSSSDIMIKLKQNPKVINEIKKLSPHTFLVGFKLLDGVDEDELFEAGFSLLRKNRCNLVVANDLSDIRAGNHEALIIYPEKSYDKASGKENIAEGLVGIISRRAFVKHPKSIKGVCVPDRDEAEKIKGELKEIGAKLFGGDYLPEVECAGGETGTYGNMSVKCKEDEEDYEGRCPMFITGRNVHKGHLKDDDIVFVYKVEKTSPDDPSVYAKVHYDGKVKPSIDAAIHSGIYRKSNHNAIIHIHTGRVFLGYPYIDEQFPCGSMEEHDAVVRRIIRNGIAQGVVQMKNHGLIVAGKSLEDCMEKIEHLFAEAVYIDTSVTGVENMDEPEIEMHIGDTESDFVYEEGTRLYPLKIDEDEIGCLWEKKEEDKDGYVNVSFALFRTGLSGDGLAAAEGVKKVLHVARDYLDIYDENHRMFLYTTPACNIDRLYKEKYGFEEIYANDKLMILGRPVSG